jgi:hypothetical protein
MKRATTYTACLHNGKIIKAKTVAKLRRIAPLIRKVWRNTNHESIQWSDRFRLDKLLKIPTKGRYVTEYHNDWVYIDSDKGVLSDKVSMRERLRAVYQHVNRRRKKL